MFVRPRVAALATLTLFVSLAVTAQAGLFVGAEDALLDPTVSFQEDSSSATACPGGILLGVAAVDITPDLAWQEPYVDLNGNGFYDAPDPVDGRLDAEPFTDENLNGKWDGLFMAGYGHEMTPGGYYTASAVHDPVWARALAISCGDQTLGLVSVDTVGLFRDFAKAIRRDATGFDHVVVASTHTHDSIDTMGLWGPSLVIDGKHPRVMESYHDGVLVALDTALASQRVVAGVRIGSGLTRDLIPMAGTVQTDLRDPFVIDDRVVAAQFVDASAETIATVINWSPHPETMAGTVGEISSDYPHYLRLAIERDGASVGGEHKAALGGTAVFFSGAVGGMMTTLGARPLDESGAPLPDYSYEKVARIGEVAAFVALDALEAAPLVAPDALRTDVRLVTTPADNAFLFALNTLGVLDHEVAVGPVEIAGATPLGIVPPIPFLRTETDVVTLSAGGQDLLQVLTIPGELLPEVALGNPLRHDAEATPAGCFAYDPLKELFNAGREGKWDPATGVRTAGFARQVASNPAYPKEPAFLSMSTASHVMLFGLANDEVGYVVSADDFVLGTLFPDLASDGRDRCGDSDHYEETNSGSSLLAPSIANAIAGMLDPTFVPAPMPPATNAAGIDPATARAWVDTSRSGGYEENEDTHVATGTPTGMPGCWGFLNGASQDIGQEPSEEARGLWMDMTGDCEPGQGDAILFADAWALSEGQPYWRP